MPSKRRHLDDNPPQDTIKKDPAYKSLSERIMYRFWDDTPIRDIYHDIDNTDFLQNNRQIVDEWLGNAPQRTYFLNRNKQRQSMLYNGWTDGTPGDYGLVSAAVGNRNIPVYQTKADDIARDYLIPIANVNDKWYGQSDAELKHAGSYPSTVYVDGRTGNTFYQKAWDLNDYGAERGGKKINRSNRLARFRAALADKIGSPIVQTTGYSTIDGIYRNIDEVNKLYNDYLAEHGLHIQDGFISLPEVHVRARRLKDGGKIYIKPENRGKSDIPPYTQFLNTLPDNLKNSGDEYNMRRYWELNGYPKDFSEGVQKGMFTKQDDGYHANSVVFNPITNSYEFMKDRNHPTYNMELDWYYSDNPEAVEFRKNYKYTPGIGMIPDQYTPIFKNGGSIHIKPENRGKFTALKEHTGHSATWFKNNGTPAQKKMAVFALNARKWKH